MSPDLPTRLRSGAAARIDAADLRRLLDEREALLKALDDACAGYCHHCRTVGENNGQGSCPESPSCPEREQMWWSAQALARGGE